MVVRFVQWTLDVENLDRTAAFGLAALAYRIDMGGDGSAKPYPRDDAPPEVPTLWLQGTGEPKQGKNDNHPDLRPRTATSMPRWSA